MNAPEHELVLLRHGHSEWNLSDRFTGWTDIPLTDVGLAEAAAAGRRLAQAGYAFDEVHGSVLQRSRQTVEILLAAMGTPAVPYFCQLAPQRTALRCTAGDEQARDFCRLG